MKYIGLVVFLGLLTFIHCQTEPPEGRCHVPKMTFTSVVDLPDNSPYIGTYIKVAWCLYPSVPKKIEKLYVQISSRHSNDRRYFEILNHKECRCHQFHNKSTAGYDELRKANIREINKSNNVYMASIRCNDGPPVYREWLGKQFVNPWIKVNKCISYDCKPSKVKTIKKLKLHKDGSKIKHPVIQHVKCTNS